MENCIFCKIISNQVPSYVVDENEYAIAILPKNMECFGHTLVITKKIFWKYFWYRRWLCQRIHIVYKKSCVKI